MKKLTDLEVALKLEEIEREEAKQETLEDIAQWVIEFRIAKNEYSKVSDFEMYHTIIEKVSKWQQERMYSEDDVVVAFFEGQFGKYSFNDWIRQFKKK